MRILVAEDDAALAEVVSQTLRQSGYAVDWVKNGADADSALTANHFDLLILDLGLPKKSGLDVLKRLRAADSRLPVLILSMHSEDVHGSRVLRGGAAGYITKDSAPQELSTAVRKVANGGKYVSASLAEILASECSSDPQKALHEKLSDREYRVMWLLASGKQISEIAKEMGLSPSTVSTYRTRILRKLGLTSNAALVHYAVRHQLVG